MLTFANNQQGLSLLVIVVVLGLVGLTIGLGGSLLGLGELELGHTTDQGLETRAFADVCAEEALHRLRTNAAYTGGTVTQANKSCEIGIASSAFVRTITVTSTIGVYSQKVIVESVVSNNTITVTSWQSP